MGRKMNSFIIAVCCNHVRKFLNQSPRQIKYSPVLPPIHKVLNPSSSYERKLTSIQLAHNPIFRQFATSAGQEDYEPDDDDVNEPFLEMLDDLRHKKKAFEAATDFEEWRKEGFKPNLRVFERLLTVFLEGGEKKNFKSACKYLIEMADKFYLEKSRVQGNFVYVLYHCDLKNKQGIADKLWTEAEDRKLDLKAMEKQLHH